MSDEEAGSVAGETEIDIDDVIEGVDKGEIVLPRQLPIDEDDVLDLKRLEQFILGDITWAQLNGMTIDEAYAIAEYGFSLFNQGRYHDARAVFEGLIVCNPYDAYFHTMLGAVYQQLDMTEEALEEYTTAVELDGEHLHAFVNRGELRLKSQDFPGALADLERAVALDPEGKSEAGVRAQALTAATVRALEELKAQLGEN